jgi:hypothetical protein
VKLSIQQGKNVKKGIRIGIYKTLPLVRIKKNPGETLLLQENPEKIFEDKHVALDKLPRPCKWGVEV